MAETTPRKRDWTGLLLAGGLLLVALIGGIWKLATAPAPSAAPADAGPRPFDASTRPDLATAARSGDDDDNDDIGDPLATPGEPPRAAAPSPSPAPKPSPKSPPRPAPPRAPSPRVDTGGSGGDAFEVRGGLPKDVVRRIIQRHIYEVRFCYERELVRSPNLAGRVTVQFTIAPGGSVVASSVRSSTLKSPPVEQCLAAATRRWEFPRPQGGGIAIVTFPFTFASAN